MILRNMQDHSSALVQQAIMVSEELIRVAILWHEQWHEGLEDASRWEGGGEGVGRRVWGEGEEEGVEGSEEEEGVGGWKGRV